MMTHQCIVGIDPGLSGAVAFYFPHAPAMIAAEDMPVMDGRVNAVELARMIEQMRPDGAVIELVGAMLGQGLSSTFKFGIAFGIVSGIISALKIPVHYITPTKWKKHYSLSADKEQSRRRAIELWPDHSALFKRKKDHGRAEAALLARYGAENVFHHSTPPVLPGRGAAGGSVADRASPISAT